MSEIEKLYKNAGVGYLMYVVDTFPPVEYPQIDFTAEKQLELVKWCCKKCRRFYIYNINDIDNFAENLAKEFNHYWQDLTEQERTQIAEILKG